MKIKIGQKQKLMKFPRKLEEIKRMFISGIGREKRNQIENIT